MANAPDSNRRSSSSFPPTQRRSRSARTRRRSGRRMEGLPLPGGTQSGVDGTVRTGPGGAGGRAAQWLAMLGRANAVDVALWGLRIAVVLVVVVGTIGTLIKGRYNAAQWFDFVMFGLTIGSIY